MECKIGVVESLERGQLHVRIQRQSACSSCHAKGVCTSADAKDELITITHYTPGLQVGDTVDLRGHHSISLRAVLYAFVLPLVLILVSSVVLSVHGVGDDLLVLILLSILVAYVGVLWLLRGYFARTLVLYAERRCT